MNYGRNIRFFFLTGFVRVAQQCFLLSPESWTGPVFHPGGHGELVRQVLGNHVVGNVGGLPSVEPVDEVAVAAAVRQEGRRPVGGGAGSREEVRAAGLSTCSIHMEAPAVLCVHVMFANHSLYFNLLLLMLLQRLLLLPQKNIDSKFHPDLTSLQSSEPSNEVSCQ